MVYSWSTAYKIQMGTVMLAYAYIGYIIFKTSQSSPYRPINVLLLSYARSTLSVWISALAALLLPTTVALFLTSGFINRHMAWFSHEWYGALIFGPMGIFGAYGVQYLFYSGPGPLHVDMEYGLFNSLVAFFAGMTFLTTLTGVASSYVFWVFTTVLLVSALVNEFAFKQPSQVAKYMASQPKIHTWTYAIATLPLTFIYSDNIYALIDIFVPLTGRMGVDTPVDVIISVIFGSVSFFGCLPSMAHIHRFGKKTLAKILALVMLAQLAILISVVVSGGSPGEWAFPYDEMHPKRL